MDSLTEPAVESGILLTPAARERMKRYVESTPEAVGVRLGVKRTGCSGWGYVIDLAHEQSGGDRVVEADGVRILVDADSWPLVAGTEVDFVQKGLSKQFAFRNPNAAAECGCGESFTTGTVDDTA